MSLGLRWLFFAGTGLFLAVACGRSEPIDFSLDEDSGTPVRRDAGAVPDSGLVAPDAGDSGRPDAGDSGRPDAGDGGRPADAGPDAAVPDAGCTRLPGVIAWWDADSDGGVVAHDIGGAHDGTLLGGATVVSGKVGSAFAFTNGTAVVEVPDDPGLNPASALSIEAWVRPASLSPVWARIVSKQRDNVLTSAYVLGTGTWGGVYFGLFQGGWQTYVDGVKPLKLSLWNHVAGTWDGTRLRIYVDGALQPQSALLSGLITVTNDPVRIGKGDSPRYPFTGEIDEVTLYGRALTAAEIADIYAAGPAGKCKAP